MRVPDDGGREWGHGRARSLTFATTAGQSAETQRASHLDVVMWGATAETTARYLSKGRLVFVEGRLQTRSWEHEGITRRRTEIVASRVQFLDAAKAGTEFAGPQLVGAVPDAGDEVPF